MAKRNILSECVLQRDSIGKLWLMNRSGELRGSRAIPVASEAAFLDEYNARLGEWTQDACVEYCPVIPLGREEMDTIPDGEDDPSQAFVFHDMGGQVPIGESEALAFRHIMGATGGSLLVEDTKSSTRPTQGLTNNPILFVVEGEGVREDIPACSTEGLKPIVIVDGPNVLTGYSFFGSDLGVKKT